MGTDLSKSLESNYYKYLEDILLLLVILFFSIVGPNKKIGFNQQYEQLNEEFSVQSGKVAKFGSRAACVDNSLCRMKVSSAASVNKKEIP